MSDEDLARPLKLEVVAASGGGYALLTLRLPGMQRDATVRLSAVQTHELAFDALMAASVIELPTGIGGEQRSMQRSAQPHCRVIPHGPLAEAESGELWIGHFELPIALEPPEEE